jgi:hypothetical protein
MANSEVQAQIVDALAHRRPQGMTEGQIGRRNGSDEEFMGYRWAMDGPRMGHGKMLRTKQ